MNFTNSPVITRRLMLPSRKTPLLVGFYFFFAPFGFWWSCCPRVNSSFAAPSSMNHFMSQLGFHFGVADQWMRRRQLCSWGCVFPSSPASQIFWSTATKGDLCFVFILGSYFQHSLLWFFSPREVFGGPYMLASFSLLGSTFGDVICYVDTFLCFSN